MALDQGGKYFVPLQGGVKKYLPQWRDTKQEKSWFPKDKNMLIASLSYKITFVFL